MSNTLIVTVSVDSEGNTSVDKPILPMPKHRHDLKIHWQIASTSSNWFFTDSGIQFGANDQFSDPRKSQGGKSFHWTNANSNTDAYHYVISVTDTHHVRSIDPIIENDGTPHEV